MIKTLLGHSCQRRGVRDYDPFIAQFTTPDPLVREHIDMCADSPLPCNLYAYAAGNPLSYIDPDGRWPQPMWVGEVIKANEAIDQSVLIATVSNNLFRTSRTVESFASFAAVRDEPIESMGLGPIAYLSPGFRLADKIYDTFIEPKADKPSDPFELRGLGPKGTGNLGGIPGGRGAPGGGSSSRGGPPRDSTGNYLPDPMAQGAHTTLGTRTSSRRGESYTQGLTAAPRRFPVL